MTDAQHYKSPSESFDVPEEWIGRTIECALALPMGMPNKLGTGMEINYPSQVGELLKIYERSLILRIEAVSKGEKKNRLYCLPKSRIWGIICDETPTSKIEI